MAEYWNKKLERKLQDSITQAEEANLLLVTDLTDAQKTLVEVVAGYGNSENPKVVAQFLVTAPQATKRQYRDDRLLSRLVQRSEVIPTTDYTDPQPAFYLSKEQREAISTWVKEHNKTHLKPGETTPYWGAIGGGITYNFTGTSLGQVVTVKCACGASADVSDYDGW